MVDGAELERLTARTDAMTIVQEAMVASWVRKDFGGAVGVTQYPPGPHLRAIQDHCRGRALLCIDVSWSMEGERLAAAVAGAQDFLTEAAEAHYVCGLVLWNSRVVTHLPTNSEPSTVRNALRMARAGGGTTLAPTLRAAIKELGPIGGDRVVCVFSDGAINDAAEAERLAAEARALGIRATSMRARRQRCKQEPGQRPAARTGQTPLPDGAMPTSAASGGVIASMVADLGKKR